jgi:hypothetical protein
MRIGDFSTVVERQAIVLLKGAVKGEVIEKNIAVCGSEVK